MDNTVKSYLMEAYEGYSKSLVQVDEFLAQQEEQLQQAKDHRETMVSKIKELEDMLDISSAEVSEVEATPV